MKKLNIKKTFAILGAIFTGGMTIGLIGVIPLTAEAALSTN
jgi:hypothetical protein